MTYQEALASGVKLLEANNIADAKTDAWFLFSHATGLTRQKYFLEQKTEIDEISLYKYQEILLQRSKRVPTQYIIGEQEFMGLNFWVNENVLIPRQDTETLVDEALKVIPSGSRVLDICTGSGCIIISLAKLGQGIMGTGVDISSGALNVAIENASRLEVNVDFIESDLFEKVTGKYNAIVSNPPYIRTADIEDLEPEVKSFEPRIALDGTADGLYFYRSIISNAADYLLEGGSLLFEIGYDQGEDVANLMKEAKFMDVKVIKDLAGNDRVVSGHL